MGGLFSRLFMRRIGVGRPSVCLLGLDAAGKTTILYHLKLGEVVTTIPTIGFNVESVECESVSMTVWDIGGQDKLRPLWRHYLQNTQAVVFVVDSSDRDRMDQARAELGSVLAEPGVAGVPLLLYANKCDVPGAMGEREVEERMQVDGHPSRPMRVQASCALTGQGLTEGFVWLAQQLKPGK